MFVAAIIATWAGLTLTGAANHQALLDPGDLVRWGGPIVRTIRDWSMAAVIGSLVFAGFSLEPKQLPKLLTPISLISGVWAISGFFTLVFSYAAVTGSAISAGSNFGEGIYLFATTIAVGQAIAINTAIALIVSILALAIEKLYATGLLAALALAAVIPLATSGHSAAVQGHDMAVNSIGIHLVAASVWVGGLVGLLISRTKDQATDLKLSNRYSSLALFAYALVAVSGVAAALVRIQNISSLFAGYGLLVLLKAIVLIVLGGFGAIYRLRLLKKISDGLSSFFKLVIAELVLMGIALGFASALARSAPPAKAQVSDAIPTAAQILTGEKLPPELTLTTWVTAIRIDLVWLLVVLIGTGFYLYGVWRFHKRGDSWPVIRTISWVAGMLTLLYITNGSMNVYEKYLFSVHMIAHMMLTMAVPVLLVPGAPITLLLRTVAKRADQSWGVREWALWAVHTKWAQFVSHPIVAAINFAASLVVFYFTPIFGWATRDHLAHEWMIVHFLITGYLFVQALVGIDPGPKHLDYPIRLMLLIGTLTFHAFFGLALMQGDSLLLADWYGAMGRTWGALPIDDQKTGGAIAWGVGELPSAVLTLVVSIQWARSDTRESKRLDRASDRTGNQDVEAYNEMLAKLANREERRK